MKRNIIAGSLVLGLIAAGAGPAQAINKEWAAVAGFVGGVLVSQASANHHRSTTVVHHHVPARETVVYHEPVPSGYWEYRTERVWTPGAWIHREIGCGRYQRIWQPGYYRTVQHRVWVESPGYCSTRTVRYRR